LLYKTSQYFHIKKNDTGHFYAFLTIYKLRSTTEQMAALVFLPNFPILAERALEAGFN
jgi:hypothetical protein